MITVQVETCHKGPLTINPAILDDALIEAYTRGQCVALAIALHDLTGWQIGMVLSGQERDCDYDCGCGYHWHDNFLHALVITPDGSVFDVLGVRSADNLLLMFDHYEHSLRVTARQEAVDLCDPDEEILVEQDHEVAVVVAKMLLDQHHKTVTERSFQTSLRTWKEAQSNQLDTTGRQDHGR